MVALGDDNGLHVVDAVLHHSGSVTAGSMCSFGKMTQEQLAELLPFLCRVLADIPFPFPWAQVMLILLILYALIVPLIMIIVTFVNCVWIGLIVNFLSVQSYWSLNEVARDLENPFVYDPNAYDLPLTRCEVICCSSAMQRRAVRLALDV